MTQNTPISISTIDELHKTALTAPTTSGVYLWHDSKGTIIYVGKAKNLKNRLRSYFVGPKDAKTTALIHSATSIEYITTANEYEAFLLENTLIKQHTPKYNINLKDGKTYPMLRLTKEVFPRLLKTRQYIDDGSLYFGPFPDVQSLDAFLVIASHLFPLRHCKHLKKKGSPCLYYHIGKCCAPCAKKIDVQSYNIYVGELKQLLEENIKNKDLPSATKDKTPPPLKDTQDKQNKQDTQDLQNENNKNKGRNISVATKITALMKQAAKDLDFEKAARLRDGLKALSMINQKSIVQDMDSVQRDYIAFFCLGEVSSFAVLKMRGGRLVARDCFRVSNLNNNDDILLDFLAAFYTDKDTLPAFIYVKKTKGLSLIKKYFLRQFGKEFCPTVIGVPKNSPQTQLLATLDMASQNATEDVARAIREKGDMIALEELKKFLRLPSLPTRIEGFDIAHIGGRLPVASLVSFFNGNPDKKNYRYFRLKTTEGKIDDFASMREATARRYTRLINEKKALPDFILIDGGIGQVNAVKGVLDALGIKIPIAGLAKKEEKIYIPGEATPLVLPKRSAALRLLQRVRDETHRFATSKNQALRTKRATAIQNKDATLKSTNLCSTQETTKHLADVAGE